MDKTLFKTLGLTENEQTIYLFLLKNGETTTGPIIKETRIANSRVYESLSTLTEKGLVTYNLQTDGKHFSAQEPKILLEKHREREERIKTLIPELEHLRGSEKEETTLAVYEGFEGFKTAFKKVIDDCPKGETIFITGFPEHVYNLERLRDFLMNMNLKSAQKKQQLKILLEESTRKTLGKDRKKEKGTTVRFMPKGFASPAAMDIFLDYTYLFLWEEKPYVFMIKNKKIADSFKAYHSFLWKLAKP